MNDNTHKTMSVIDTLRTLGELEHLRFHAITASILADEEDKLSLLVLASMCQKTRRKLQKRYFSDAPIHYWCIVKSASTLLQLMSENAGGDLEELSDIKSIIDQAISLSAGEDISQCEACSKDFISTQQ